MVEGIFTEINNLNSSYILRQYCEEVMEEEAIWVNHHIYGIFTCSKTFLIKSPNSQTVRGWHSGDPNEILQWYKHVPTVDPFWEWLLHLKKLKYFHFGLLINVSYMVSFLEENRLSQMLRCPLNGYMKIKCSFERLAVTSVLLNLLFPVSSLFQVEHYCKRKFSQFQL